MGDSGRKAMEGGVVSSNQRHESRQNDSMANPEPEPERNRFESWNVQTLLTDEWPASYQAFRGAQDEFPQERWFTVDELIGRVPPHVPTVSLKPQKVVSIPPRPEIMKVDSKGLDAETRARNQADNRRRRMRLGNHLSPLENKTHLSHP
jgi:hypothetical protein